jgi:hypothetical protein
LPRRYALRNDGKKLMIEQTLETRVTTHIDKRP